MAARIITYSTVNSTLGTSYTPNNYCASKKKAIDGGGDDVYGAGFANNRLITRVVQSIVTWTITFNKQVDGVDSLISQKTVNDGSIIGAPPLPTVSGYHFDRWSPSDPDSTTATANTTFTAIYEQDAAPVYHTITFMDSDGTTVIRTDSIIHGGTITPPTVTPPSGYTWGGWSPAVPATATADGTYTATYDEDPHGKAAGPFYIGALSSSDANSQFHCIGDEAVSGNAYPNLNTNAVYTITGKYYVNNAVVEEFSGTATTTPAGGFAPDVTLSSELAKYGWENAATTGNGWKLLKNGMEAFQPTGEYWEFYISCPTYIIRKYDDHHAYCRL